MGGSDRRDVQEEECNLLEIYVILAQGGDWDGGFR